MATFAVTRLIICFGAMLMIRKYFVNIMALMTLAALGACSGRSAAGVAQATPAAKVEVPVFDADSAYRAVAAQVAMGPRTPGSESAARCAAWIEGNLARFGADTVIIQREMMAHPMEPGRKVPMVNILGRFNPGAEKRLMLVAHYDTRPVADEESDPALAAKPIDGANDGGSGVGVMMELARLMAQKRPDAGVDLLFVDLEDSGTSGDDASWCIGSQYFAENLPYKDALDRPQAAVVLDMVGGQGARFHREGFSQHYQPGLVARVWDSARRAGYSSTFPLEDGGAIIDDHLPLLRAGIPAIDIVESRSATTGNFPLTWHTHGDNLDAIDPATLKAVGQTLAFFIYNF